MKVDLFAGAAKGYTKYRGEYPDEVIKILAAKLNLNGMGRLLDIGCGDGRLTFPLAPHFKEIVAVDISPAMINEAQDKALSLGISNIQWLVKNADELNENLEKFDCITFGQALHWLNIEKIIAFSHKSLTDDGAIVIVTGHSIWNYAPTKWEKKMLELIKKYLGPERKTLQGKFPTSQKSYEDYLLDTGFERIEKFSYRFPLVAKTVEEVIAEQFTTSYAARELFEDKLNEFIDEAKTELLKIQPDNKFITEQTGEMIIAYKNSTNYSDFN